MILEMSCGGGTLISQEIRDAIAIARKLSCRVRFTFNGVVVTVGANTDIAEAEARYDRDYSSRWGVPEIEAEAPTRHRYFASYGFEVNSEAGHFGNIVFVTDKPLDSAEGIKEIEARISLEIVASNSHPAGTVANVVLMGWQELPYTGEEDE